MKKTALGALLLLVAGCATTYHLPEEERSRSYMAPMDQVWEAALSAVDDIDLALVESEEEHGRIRARSGWSIWDLRGHLLLVQLREDSRGRIRVDANAESASEEVNVDFGHSSGIVKDYLEALDRRLLGTGGGDGRR